MAAIHRSEIVPFTCNQMYDLVDAIDQYPQFLPWCKDAKILSRNQDEVKATLVLAWGGLQKSFTTCNRLQPHKMIEVRLVEGPFHHLEGFWRFQMDTEATCNVILDLEFEFVSRWVSMAFGPVFHHAINTLVEAFCQRAERIYTHSG